MNSADKAKNKEYLRPSQRIGEIFAVIGMLFLLGFLAYHQIEDTGFMTEDFGSLAMFALYVPIVVGIVPLLIRARTGRRNPARPFDAFSSLFLTLTALYLLVEFPFDYAHLADPLPNAIDFLLSWVNDTVAVGVFMLIIVVNSFTAIYHIAAFVWFRDETPKHPTMPQTS